MNRLGRPLILIGSTIGTIGSVINTIWFDHQLAIIVWGISNPVLFTWSLGAMKGKWNDGLSYRALAVMYGTFTITGVWAIWKMM
jgi:hypothetical protein